MSQILSSDTNIWIDFDVIGELDLPFLLPVSYVMFEEAIREEMTSPSGEQLKKLGLNSVEITEEEFYYALDLLAADEKLSMWDCIALAMAKKRSIWLLSGDKRLRQAAERERVYVVGSIWILDRLLVEQCISPQKYQECLQKLLNDKSGKIRLPKEELQKRLIADPVT